MRNSNSNYTDSKKTKKKKSVITSFSEDDNTELELDPIRTDISDSLFESNSEDAIVTKKFNNT